MAYLNPNEQATERFLRQLRDEEARRLYLLRAGRGNVYTPEPIAASFPAPRTAMDLIGSGMQSDQIRSLEQMGQARTPMLPLTPDPIEVIQESVRPPSPAVPFRQVAGSAQQAQEPAKPPRDTRSFNYNVPVAPKTSAVQTAGLLDTEEPAEGGSFYDDPMRMGLLQAGLGLMSAPRYSTNPNDVTLSSALARGLGGFVQGYGGTKKRLSEAERQKLDDDFKRQQMEKDIEYKDALIQMYGIQGEAQRKNAELNATEKQRQKQAIAAQVERILKHEGKLGNTTRRLELNRLATSDNTNQQNQFADLYRESTTDRTPMEEKLVASGKYTEEDAKKLRFTALETQYDKILDLQTNPPNPKTETKPTEGQKLRDDLERVFIYDPTTGERKIDHVYRNSPEYRKGIDQHLDSLQSSVSVGGVGTFEKPRYPLPDGIDWGVDLATPGRKVTDLGSFVQVEGLGDNQEKINSSFATLNKLQKLQNKLVEYGKPELAERLTKKDPKVRELVSDYYDLLLTLKEEYNLGVLTGNDEQIIKSVIADPTSVDLSNFFSGLDTFVASLNSVKKSVIDNLRPVASQYNIDIMDQYNAIPGYRPLTFDPISVVPPDNDSAGYNSEAKSILQEIQTDVGPQEDPNMWNPLNWFNNN